MIYPNDIYSKSKQSGKLTEDDKARVIMAGVVLVNVVIFAVCIQLFTSLGIPLAVIIVVQLLLVLIICINIYRFMIFREQERDIAETDNYIQYHRIRPLSKEVKLSSGSYSFMEMQNNTFLVPVQFKFGRNDASKSKHTENFIKSVTNLLYEKNLSHRWIVMSENFADSQDAGRLLKRVNSVEEPLLRRSLLQIYNETFKFASDNGDSECLVLFIYAKNAFYLDVLEDAIVQLEALYRKGIKQTAFRSCEFLNHKSLLEISTQFHGMGAIDLSLSKIQLNSMDSDLLKAVELYKIKSVDGKVYVNDIFASIQTGVVELK